jgi:hypothetical protein
MRGVLAFLAITLPWFVAMQRRYPAFFDYFFVEQHVRRFAGSTFNNHQPLWFAAAALLALCLPWTLPALAGRWRAAAPRESAETSSVRRLMWAWCIGVVVFFSIPQSKLIGYVLPAAAPLVALAALNLRGASFARWPDLRVRAVAAGTALCLFAAVAVFAVQARHSSRDIATALSAQRQAGEPVVGWRVFPYDVQLYARMSGELWIADDWNRPSLTQNDGWHKELADASRFGRSAGPTRLVAIDDLMRLLSRAPAAWIIVAGRDLPAEIGNAFDAREVASTHELSLWRVTPRPVPKLTQSEVKPPHRS